MILYIALWVWTFWVDDNIFVILLSIESQAMLMFLSFHNQPSCYHDSIIRIDLFSYFQSYCRKFLARVHYLSIKKAAISTQCAWRCKVARKELQKLKMVSTLHLLSHLLLYFTAPITAFLKDHFFFHICPLVLEIFWNIFVCKDIWSLSKMKKELKLPKFGAK